MTNLQGTPKQISQMAEVCTEKQFEELCRANPTLINKEYVYLLSTQVRNELNGGVIKGALPKGCVAVVPVDCYAGYLSFLLNSLPAQYMLFGGLYNSKSKVKINKKLVSSLVIYDVEFDSQNAYELADSIRRVIYDKYNNNREDAAYHHLYYLLADLCNMLALELYAHPLFEEKGIHILECWKEVAKEASSKENYNIVFDSLIKSDGKLRNELMKAHVLIDDVSKYIKFNINGLEDK